MGGGGVMGRSSERFRTFSTMYVPSIRINGLKFYLLVQLREVEGEGQIKGEKNLVVRG